MGGGLPPAWVRGRGGAAPGGRGVDVEAAGRARLYEREERLPPPPPPPPPQPPRWLEMRARSAGDGRRPRRGERMKCAAPGAPMPARRGATARAGAGDARPRRWRMRRRAFLRRGRQEKRATCRRWRPVMLCTHRQFSRGKVSEAKRVPCRLIMADTHRMDRVLQFLKPAGHKLASSPDALAKICRITYGRSSWRSVQNREKRWKSSMVMELLVLL